MLLKLTTSVRETEWQVTHNDIAVVAVMIGGATIGFEAGQATPDTEQLFTSIAEKNQ